MLDFYFISGVPETNKQLCVHMSARSLQGCVAGPGDAEKEVLVDTTKASAISAEACPGGHWIPHGR